MAIDASIISGLRPVQFESPVNALAQMLQVQGAQQQNQLGQIRLDEHQRGVERTNRLQSLLSGMDPRAPVEDRVGRLTTGGFLTEAQSLAESAAKAAKDQREAEKAARESKKFEFEHTMQKVRRGAEILGSATDQLSYDAARQTAQAEGLDVSRMPPQFDPVFVKAKRMEALSMQEQMEQQWKKLGYDLEVKKAGELARHNRAVEGTAAGQLGVAKARERREAHASTQGQYDSERGLIIDKRTSTARPVLGPDGRPLQTGAKMTEDQAKATGWLVQAENAWANMKAVGMDKDGKPTSATRPGFNDALARIPGFGAVANNFRSTNRQKFMQGASSLSEALLRAATGAGVNRDEAQQKVAELTPQFGESEETTMQKLDSIPVYIESLKVRAGPGAAKAANVLNSARPTQTSNSPDIEAIMRKYGQ